jgi:hypothetical protein
MYESACIEHDIFNSLLFLIKIHGSACAYILNPMNSRLRRVIRGGNIKNAQKNVHAAQFFVHAVITLYMHQDLNTCLRKKSLHVEITDLQEINYYFHPAPSEP